MGTVNLKMKLSAILIAAVSASPVAHDKDSGVAKSGQPMSGKPMSGGMRPMSGHRSPGHKDQDGHGDMEHEMEDWEEEFDEGYGKDKFDMEAMKEKMMKMVKGKVMKMMKYKLEMIKPYLPVIKAMIEEMTGMDCEELIAMIEEKVFDGHKIAEVMYAIKNGHITKEDMKMWAMEKWEECEFAQMSEEEKMEWMTEFLGRFGIDCEKVQAGIEEMIGMKFEDIKKMFEDHMADHSGDMDDIDVDDIVDDVMDVFPM